jgi:hypothetical protein
MKDLKGGNFVPKAVEKVKDRVRGLTIRSRNLDARVVKKLNAVIRGVANYFATDFSTVTRQFRYLDHWLRKRIRMMKLKRISRFDNVKIRNRHIRRIGVIYLSDQLPAGSGC